MNDTTEADVPFVQPLIMSAMIPLKAGTEIRCQNGHAQAKVVADVAPGTMHYGGNFGEWKQPGPIGQRFPIRCAKCGSILIAATEVL